MTIRPASVSLVLCCYNSTARLPQTLSYLARQVVPPDVAWEVIVVDNASSDGTGDAARRIWPTDAPAPLRVVQELRSGVSWARYQGYKSACHDIVAYVDDDNWVCPTWVASVSNIMTRHPDVGACGGSGAAAMEGTAPPWFERFETAYAVGTQGAEAGDIPDRPGILWGAGMSVRRDALDQVYAAGFRHLMASRAKGSLASGEDAELSYALRLAGWRLYYDPTLAYQHYMPASRLSWSYFMRLQHALGEASVPLKHYELRLSRRWRTSPLMRVRDTWMGETALCALALVGVGLRAVCAIGRDPAANSRLRFKFGKFLAVATNRESFKSSRDQVQALQRELLSRQSARTA